MKKEYIINLDIYNTSKVLEAIDDFNEVTSFSLHWDTLTIEGDSQNEIDIYFNEIMNYLLSL